MSEDNGGFKDDPTQVGVPPAPKMPSAEDTLQGAPGPFDEDIDTQRIVLSDGISYRVYGDTDVGLSRDHNEDNFLVADLNVERPVQRGDSIMEGSLTERGFALGVCDGMGGAAAGEVASQMAVDVVVNELRGHDAAEDRDSFARRLVRAIESAGAAIHESSKSDRDRRGMGTTATVAGLVDKVLFIGQVGDSRCYVLRNGKLSLLTKDQSLVNQLIEAGQLTEMEAAAFEHSNIILQALGTADRVSVDLTFLELRRGDRLLLCSDGLCGLVHDSVIEETLGKYRDLREVTAQLIELANVAGGHDNITCVVADFDGAGLEPLDDAPQPFYQQYPLPAGDSDFPGPPRGPVIKSMIPRAPVQVARKVSDRSPEPQTRAFSWPTALGVLFLFGLAAVIAALSGRSEPVAAPAPPVEVPSAEGKVQVQIGTDVTFGDLLVNGESYGPISSNDEPTILELAPGAYRFEVVSKGDVESIQELVVRAGVPARVTLNKSDR